MYVIKFKTMPAMLGRALSQIAQLRAPESHWISLCSQLEKCRVVSPVDEDAALAVLNSLAKDLVQQSKTPIKAQSEVNIQGVVFMLRCRNFVQLEKATVLPGLYSTCAHLGDDMVNGLVTSLLKDKTSFTADFRF